MLFMIGGILTVLSGIYGYIWSYYLFKIAYWLEKNTVENYKKYDELGERKDIKRFYKDFDSGLIYLDGQTVKNLKTARMSLNIGKILFTIGVVLMVIHLIIT